MFCKMYKGNDVYVVRNNPFTQPEGWNIQVLQLFHGISICGGGSTYGGHNLVTLTRKDIGKINFQLKISAASAISGCLEVRVGENKAHLGTLDMVQDLVCWKGKRRMVYYLLYPVGR